LYAIQGLYTSIYLIYLAILALSIYGLISGIALFDLRTVRQIHLKKTVRVWTGVFLLVVVAVLSPLWVSLMLPGISAHQASETYGVFVLDLALVFPALPIVDVMLFRRQAFAYVLAGVVLFKAFTVCLSVAFGEWYGPYVRGLPVNDSALAIFSLLTVVSGMLFGIYLQSLSTNDPHS
jgi:hypothetical protein